MKKTPTLLLVAIFVALATIAQKPKATFDHNTFAKRAATAFNSYGIEHMCADYNGLKYIVTTTGKTLDEVTEQNNTNKETILKDVDLLRKKGIFAVYEKAEVSVIQETPLKIADILIFGTYKGKSYTLVLKNCIQSNTTWILGDHIEAKGDGVEELISSKEAKEEKFANSFLGKAQAAEKEQLKKDSTDQIAEEGRRMTTRQPKGYRAVLFPPQAGTPTAQYIHSDQIDKPLNGYYITKEGAKVNAVIAYEAPEKLLLHGWNLAICKEANDKKEALYYDGIPNFLKSIKKDDLQAFFVGDQLFVQYSAGKWAILIAEGAIRSLVLITKITLGEKTTYEIGNLIQKLTENPENHFSLSLQFKQKMSENVKENAEMAAKIKAGAEGYTTLNLTKIINEYNPWYDQQFPGKTKYLPLGLPEPAEPVSFVSISSKEDLKSYLAQKEWEIVSLTPTNGNVRRETIEGTDKVQQLGLDQKSEKYRPIELFANGTVLKLGAYAGTWETKDKQTVIINTGSSNPELFGIRFTQANRFVADTRDYTGGPRESISTFQIRRALTDKEWNKYDSTKNSMARKLPVEFKGLVGSWTFDKMLKGTADVSEQFPLGKINGKPIWMDFSGDGWLFLPNGVYKTNGIETALWAYAKSADHDLELMMYYDATKKNKKSVEKYTIVSVSSTELIYEDKATATKYIWKKKN